MESTADLERRATDLVRYALACHAAGKAMRREDIRTHVLSGAGSRGFKPVMDRATSLLEQNFGLQIVPLPVHERRGGGVDAKDAQQNKAVSKWVLQSTLPDSARARLELEQSDIEKATLGFAATVLSLIFVNNMSISNDQLVLYVRKLESAAQAAIVFLVKQGYLDKVAAHGGAGRSTGGETQASQQPHDGNEPDPGQEYTWGPQAKVRFQQLDMTQFIAAVTGQECTIDFIKAVSRAYGQNIVDGETI
ncbi:hypothetical protein COEREDRAFT_44205 [Coemansia reversa NRRL 1564]|uniref:MAGE domain-containing protein n=1 Tax=Coemansia reversa (strain ATCC 12441 / NRRL 1564) TaxID=763665 RepID=A0A2G5BAT7_COERN|nr:hypothetical protein COEREDRAFT_44205 [Coemansia reversa NRRL 1564]|eukprot:PIA15827.1 hypothetical protein COEREDRAFT_44205 [Coemansia reversa NRRL 1564]